MKPSKCQTTCTYLLVPSPFAHLDILSGEETSQFTWLFLVMKLTNFYFLLYVNCWSRHGLGQSLYDGEDSGMVTIHCHRLDQALHRTMEILISNIWKDLCTVCQHKIVMIEKFVEFRDPCTSLSMYIELVNINISFQWKIKENGCNISSMICPR